MMMKGKISQDSLLTCPASSVWQIYGGFNLSHFVNKHLSDTLGTVDFIQGDGGVDSVVRLTFPPGSPGVGYLVERFRIMDNEMRIKETEQIDGGFLALGFTSARVRLEVIEKDPESCMVRSTVEYEIEEKVAENVSLVSLEAFEMMAKAVEKHLLADADADKPS